MDAETPDVIAQLSGRMDALEAALRDGFRAGLATRRCHTDEKFAEARRHAQVLTESVRDDIRIVADGLATLIVKVDALAR